MKEKLAEYEDFFHDSFPTFMFTHLPEKEIIKIIDDCLNQGLDAYDAGYVKEEDFDVKY